MIQNHKEVKKNQKNKRSHNKQNEKSTINIINDEEKKNPKEQTIKIKNVKKQMK